MAALPLVELAEAPGRWLPDDGLRELIELPGATVCAYGSSVAVEAIRLEADAVVGTIERVRALARDRGADDVLWWVGDRSLPANLEARLAARGFVPDPGDPELTTLTLTRPPRGAAAVEVRPVTSLPQYLRALAIDWEVFDLPQRRRDERRALAAEQWRRLCAAGNIALHLAWVDGEPVAFGRTVFTPAGGLMLGGATLPRARGLGAYTSLVHARWEEAVRRGTAALGVAAGAMSAPILLRLGFVEHTRVRLLLDRLTRG